jgi:AraC family transcriptional regulator of adaptative response/methylated-DNA-[protein]-cysteine methyltransferase
MLKLEEAANASPPLEQAAADYAHVRRAIAFLGEGWNRQPAVGEIAEHVGLSESHLTHLFKRWAGLSPKTFLQALTLDHARALLRDSASVLDASLEVGLSGPGRLHDLFVTHEAMSPGEYKARGEGLTLTYGWHASPFGEALMVASGRGLAGLGWVDEDAEGGHEAARHAALADMVRRWPRARFQRDDAATAPHARRVFDPASWLPEQPLRVVLIGSDFEVSVWRSLLTVPLGAATTYSGLAGRIGKPRAARAVGAAVGRNPISFVVPCHRVLGASGHLTGYHWGLTRKQAILGWEAGRIK